MWIVPKKARRKLFSRSREPNYKRTFLLWQSYFEETAWHKLKCCLKREKSNIITVILTMMYLCIIIIIIRSSSSSSSWNVRKVILGERMGNFRLVEEFFSICLVFDDFFSFCTNIYIFKTFCLAHIFSQSFCSLQNKLIM